MKKERGKSVLSARLDNDYAALSKMPIGVRLLHIYVIKTVV